MLNMMFSFMTILTSITFFLMTHPLAMSLLLILQTMWIMLMIGTMMKTFWFSYILFLTFIGGMLILFIYITSLASNEMFTSSSKTLIMMMFIIFFLLIYTMIIDKLPFNYMTNNYEMNSFENQTILFKENLLNLNKLYNFPINYIMLLMITYLLLTLIIIVKITKFNNGPLRKTF